MYDPPRPKMRPTGGIVLQIYLDYSDTLIYDQGYAAAHLGRSREANPYELSGHERDTTYSDELNMLWGRGFDDYHEE